MNKPILKLEFYEGDGGEVLAQIETADVEIRETGKHVIDAGKKALKSLGEKALRFGLARCMNQLTLDLGDGKVIDLSRSGAKAKKGGPDA